MRVHRQPLDLSSPCLCICFLLLLPLLLLLHLWLLEASASSREVSGQFVAVRLIMEVYLAGSPRRVHLTCLMFLAPTKSIQIESDESDLNCGFSFTSIRSLVDIWRRIGPSFCCFHFDSPEQLEGQQTKKISVCLFESSKNSQFEL